MNNHKLEVHLCGIHGYVYCNGDCDNCFRQTTTTTTGTGTLIAETTTKCEWPSGISVKPDGIHELDPCIYEEIEVIENCTVRLLRCKYCGHEEWEWERNE